jgi:serine/threonine protein kinase
MQCSAAEPGPAILTAFMPNGSIENIRQKCQTVSPARKMIWLSRIAPGMCLLHFNLNVVHSDLKPANVLLWKDLEPLVADLGPAKIIQSNSGSLRQTAVAGSPV